MQIKNFFILLLLYFLFPNFLLGGNVTISLVGVNPLYVNVKGATGTEQAGSFSVFIYFNDDGITSTTTNDIDATQLDNTFGWGNSFETKTIQSGTYIKNGHTFSNRINYANSNVGSSADDFWPSGGVDALIINFTNVGTGHAYIEVNGSDGVADYSGNGHNVTYVNQDAPLPVELSSFTFITNSNNVNLNWKTATEVNNNGFAVERASINTQSSNHNPQFERIGFVSGHGNSNSPKEYSFTDKKLTGGTKFIYRLKQIDNDGAFKYSKELEVELVPKQFAVYQNYPNPFNPSTTIKYDLPQASKVRINIYNILGEKIMTLLDNKNVDAGFHEVQFNGSNLASGTYIYRVEAIPDDKQAGNFIQTKKMLLLK